MRFDELLQTMQQEQPEPAAADAARERVWQRLQEELHPQIEQIRGCDDVQALLPSLKTGTLPEARALLVRDHLRECATCRKVEQGGRVVTMPWRHTAPVPVSMAAHNGKWAVAAALIVAAVGLSAFAMRDRWLPAPEGSRATVQSVDGLLYKVAYDREEPLRAGEELGENVPVRTAKGAHAFVRLRDGSVVEMNERTELAVSLTRRDTTVKLARGHVIVQAAKRRSGHLYVLSNDCRVSVTGTVFSVNGGVKGSRVSVVEGEVHVAQAGAEKVLHRGDQVTTSPSLAAVPVRDEIAWSQHLADHLALLAELSELQKKVEAIPLPGLRYSSKLLDRVTADTIFFASVPNLAQTLDEAYRLFREQVRESDVLRRWWAGSGMADDEQKLTELVQAVRSLGQYLGEEVVFAVPLHGPGPHDDLLILAEAVRPGLQAFLDAELRKQLPPQAEIRFRWLDSTSVMTATLKEDEWGILVDDQLVAISGDVRQLREIAGRGNRFAATPFYNRLAASYRDGVSMLLGLDVTRVTQETLTAMRRAPQGAQEAAALQQSGLAGIEHLILERKQLGGETRNRAVMAFQGERQGVTSWLAAPAPMGSLEFISPDASFATAVVVKSPVQILDELLAVGTASSSDARRALTEAETHLGVRLKEELASAIGGEVTFALDGPLFPLPSWKLIVEVYDANRLQQAIARMVETVGKELVAHGQPAPKLTQEVLEGKTLYVLRDGRAGSPIAAYYTYVNGYLVAAASPALLGKAIQTRQSTVTLSRSDRFRAMLPKDRHANFSAIVYQNLGPALAPLAGMVNTKSLTPDQQQRLAQLSANAKPTLVYAYGEPNRIEVASNGSFFGLDWNSGFAGLLSGAIPGTSGRRAP